MFWFGLIVGLVAGTVITFFTMALLSASKRDSVREYDVEISAEKENGGCK